MSNNIYDILKKIESLEAPKKTNLTESKSMTTVKELHNESKKEKQANKGSIAEAVAKVERQLNEKYMGFKKKMGEELDPKYKTPNIDAHDQTMRDPVTAKGSREMDAAIRGPGAFYGAYTRDERGQKAYKDRTSGGIINKVKDFVGYDKPDPAYGPKTNEGAVEESGLQAYLGKKKYGETGMKALQKAGREGASKEKMALLRAKHDKMDEGSYNEDMLSAKQKEFAALAEPKDKITYADKIAGAKKDKKTEGNKFSGNLMKARAQGKDEADLDGDGDMEKVTPGKTMREGWDEMQKYLDKKRGPESKGGEGKKAGTRYGGSAQKDDDEDTDGEGKPVEKKKGRPKGTGGGAKFSFKKPKD